jgi:predicted RNA polymerase sigma factor
MESVTEEDTGTISDSMDTADEDYEDVWSIHDDMEKVSGDSLRERFQLFFSVHPDLAPGMRISLNFLIEVTDYW